MSRLVFPAPLLADIKQILLQEREETCAIGFGHPCYWEGNLTRIVVSEMQVVPKNAYLNRSPVSAVLSPEFVAQISQRARRDRLSVVFVHTHPFDLNEFSLTDDRGEKALRDFFERRTPGLPPAAMLVTPSRVVARLLGTETTLRVMEVGSTITIDRDPRDDTSPMFDRQVRALGVEGQAKLQNLQVGIVGLGGTGSVIAQELAHLGVRNLMLIDEDKIEETNLNRVIGSSRASVGRPKVQVAWEMIQQINSSSVVRQIPDTLLRSRIARALTACDIVFCCTDSHGSRAVINQVAYQYLVPVIDVGIVIDSPGGVVKNIVGRVQMLSPGLSCLICDDILDSEQVRRDLMTEDERKRDRYIVGSVEKQPAVISFNSTVSSLGVSMLLNAAIGVPGSARRLHYNAIAGTIRAVRGMPHPTCVICSSAGCLGKGDSIPLFARND